MDGQGRGAHRRDPDRQRPSDLTSVDRRPDGQPLDAARWGYYFRRARKRVGLNDSITFHDLRHLFASVLIASGCSIKQVQIALGHDSAITLDTHAHLISGDEDRVRDAIDRLPLPAPPRQCDRRDWRSVWTVGRARSRADDDVVHR